MALTAVRSVVELEGDLVLAPERYDPRRQALRGATPTGVPLRQLVNIVRDLVSPGQQGPGPYLILDTSDARDGIVVPSRRPMGSRSLQSSKKRLAAHDVIISRLRPYLRQVAWVDEALSSSRKVVEVLGSTEFFVLRSLDGSSIAFLVPLLLSAPVQMVLAAAQEGGHHPRFNETTLLDLPVPHQLLQRREETARSVKRAVSLFRRSEQLLGEETTAVEEILAGISL